MTTPGNDTSAPLACGTSSDDLLAQVADGRGSGRDAHQAGCPHCEATLAEYTRLWGPVAAVSRERVRAPRGVVDTVLAGLRAAAGPAGWARFEDQGHEVLVAARVVVAVAGQAAADVDGIRVALGGLATGAGGVEAGVSGRSVALELTVAAEYGYDLHRVADALRARVSAALSDHTGLEAGSIGVVVTDVFPPRGAPDGRVQSTGEAGMARVTQVEREDRPDSGSNGT